MLCLSPSNVATLSVIVTDVVEPCTQYSGIMLQLESNSSVVASPATDTVPPSRVCSFHVSVNLTVTSLLVRTIGSHTAANVTFEFTVYSAPFASVEPSTEHVQPVKSQSGLAGLDVVGSVIFPPGATFSVFSIAPSYEQNSTVYLLIHLAFTVTFLAGIVYEPPAAYSMLDSVSTHLSNT